MIDSERIGLSILLDNLGISVNQLKQMFNGRTPVRKKIYKTFNMIYHYINYPTAINWMNFTVRSGKVQSISLFRKCKVSELVLIIKEYKEFFLNFGLTLNLDEEKRVILENQILLIEISQSPAYDYWQIHINSRYKNSDDHNNRIKTSISLVQLLDTYPQLKILI